MKKIWSLLLAIMLLSTVSACAEQMDFPEERQAAGTEVKALADLPTTAYSRQEIWLENEGQRIYGIAYIPDVEGKLPLVILSHGLGGSYSSCLAEAEQFASHGIAAFTFDFRGGGGSRSDGDSTRMSVMTEVSDLEAVLTAAQTWDFVDADQIILNGFSQGGIVSAITAARHVDEVAGLILNYPAFLVTDDVHKEFSSLDEVPDEFIYKWIRAGRAYVADMWDYDVYAEIGNYTRPVLLMHGDADYIVPISYAERAAETYPDVEYHVMQGAGHGFNGRAFEESMELSFAYLQRIGVLGEKAEEAQEITVRMTFADGTIGYIHDLRDNATTRAFLEKLPQEIRFSDWDGREYWYSDTLPYDQDSVQHTYAIGEFTYWCGGWVTAYYSTNDDTVIEAGSVVIGIMDDTAVRHFAQLNGTSEAITFEIIVE